MNNSTNKVYLVLKFYVNKKMTIWRPSAKMKKSITYLLVVIGIQKVQILTLI